MRKKLTSLGREMMTKDENDNTLILKDFPVMGETLSLRQGQRAWGGKDKVVNAFYSIHRASFFFNP